MDSKLAKRPDSPTLAKERFLPDSPTLSAERLSLLPIDESDLSSRSPSPLDPSTKRNPRRAASVFGGILWSREGSKPIPKVERLKLVYEDDLEGQASPYLNSTQTKDSTEGIVDGRIEDNQTFYDSETSQSGSISTSKSTNFNGPVGYLDDNSSRATSRMLLRDQSFEMAETLYRPEPMKSSARSIMKKPSRLRLSDRKASNATMSTLNTPPATPTDSIFNPTKKEDITLDARFRIKQAVLKAKQRAMENLERPYIDLPPIPLKQWEAEDKLDEGEELQHSIAEAWTQLSAEIGFTTKNTKNPKLIDWHKKKTRFAPLRFSVSLSKPTPKRSTPEMQAEIDKNDPDGELRKLKHIVKTLRIEKTKEIFRPSVIQRLQTEAARQGTVLGFDPELDYDAPFIKLKGKLPDPKPTMLEMIRMFTPITDGIRIPSGRPATKKNPFSSLYRGHLTVEEYENDEVSTQIYDYPPMRSLRRIESSPASLLYTTFDPSKPGLSRNLSARFSTHKITQDFLREILQDAEEGQKAADVARDVLDMFLEKWCEGNDIRLDEPLGLEVVDNKGRVICDLEQYHYIIAYLTKWIERCERMGW